MMFTVDEPFKGTELLTIRKAVTMALSAGRVHTGIKGVLGLRKHNMFPQELISSKEKAHKGSKSTRSYLRFWCRGVVFPTDQEWGMVEDEGLDAKDAQEAQAAEFGEI